MAGETTNVCTAATLDEAWADAPGELCQGARTGRYEIAGVLGRGAMGVVYRAYDPALGRTVALKVPHHDHGVDGRASTGRAMEMPQLRARFMKEARGLAQLSHPNVVQVFSVERLTTSDGLADGACVIAMEVVEGTPLNVWLEDPHDWREVLEVFRGAGRGLAAAHAVGLVHRDFKPSNVVLGHDGRVRVMDFGLVTDAWVDPDIDASTDPIGLDVDDLACTLTETGTTVGTPAYMAPEQHLGRRVDPRSDQFAFCVALYQALFGRRPFAGRACHILSANKQLGRVRPVPRNHGVPKSVVEAVLRGLQSRPEDRFVSMNALLDALATPTAPRAVVRWARRVATLAVAGAAVGALLPSAPSYSASATAAGSRSTLSASASPGSAASRRRAIAGSAWLRM